jgi:Resolvase, N terminal domain/Integrase core domain
MASRRASTASSETNASRAEAKVIIETWRQHYNAVRPHSSLGYLTPNEFVAQQTNAASRHATSRVAGAGKIDVIVVYKVDRLTRSLVAELVELFDQRNVSFVSVTQQFNTTTSMGRLTLNVLLSFAQFEREVTAERIRDKISARKRKGLGVRSATTPGTARSLLTRPRLRGSATSFAAISGSAVSIC